MRSTLLYVVPIVLTAGSALGQEQQQYQNPMYITNGNGPVRIMNGQPAPNYVEADGPNALYPVKSYVVERQPIVLPAPNVTVNTTINMPRPAVKHRPARKHVYNPQCQCKL
jgi:hypothetical protein